MTGGPLRLKVFASQGRVARVEIDSPRIDPSAVFIGRTPEEATVLASRLFSLCPVAQSIGARAATGLPSENNETLALLCERLGEMLRASLLDWPGEAAPGEEISALREALPLLRQIAKIPSPDHAAALHALFARLGLGAAEGLFARQTAEAVNDDAMLNLPARQADTLASEDDAAVVEAMWADRAFSRAPALPGRVIETGIAARRGATGGLASRLAARECEMIETGVAIQLMLKGGPAPEGLVARGAGFAAVESARGRLYHACRLDGSGRIADYRMVAPTEWNFHARGPFARTLTGAEIGCGEAAKRRVERLAFVFDPCIRAEAEVLEPADA
jgi:hypothetical protein